MADCFCGLVISLVPSDVSVKHPCTTKLLAEAAWTGRSKDHSECTNPRGSFSPIVSLCGIVIHRRVGTLLPLKRPDCWRQMQGVLRETGRSKSLVVVLSFAVLALGLIAAAAKAQTIIDPLDM